MLHVILGSDRALARRALDRLLAEVDPTGLDIDRIDAGSTSFDAIFAAVTAAPFFGSRRVVVLSGILIQATGKGGRGGKGKSDSELAQLIDALPASTTLILFDADLGEVSVAVRKLLPSNADISVNDAPRGSALVSLTRQIAEGAGGKIDERTSRALLDRLFPGYWPQAPQNRAFDKPPSIEQLTSELEKLAIAAYPDAISTELIDDLVPQRAEDRMFRLMDAVIGGNQKGALQELENLNRAGEDPSRTMNQLYQQVELSVGALASGRPSDPLQAGRALGISSAYRMTKVIESAQRSRSSPARQLRMALETDRMMKTGRLRTPEDALVHFVARATGQTENR